MKDVNYIRDAVNRIYIDECGKKQKPEYLLTEGAEEHIFNDAMDFLTKHNLPTTYDNVYKLYGAVEKQNIIDRLDKYKQNLVYMYVGDRESITKDEFSSMTDTYIFLSLRDIDSDLEYYFDDYDRVIINVEDFEIKVDLVDPIGEAELSDVVEQFEIIDKILVKILKII